MLEVTEVLNLETLQGVTDDDAFDAIGLLIDYADVHTDLEATSKALSWCETLEARPSLSKKQHALLDYFRSNAWAVRQKPVQSDRAVAWAWDQEALQQQIFYLRRAMTNSEFEELHLIRQCQVLTNLANQFDTIGRFVEAQRYWIEALHRLPTFWMARCNRGRALLRYGGVLYDAEHRVMFALVAHSELAEGIVHVDKYPEYGDSSLKNFFISAKDSIDQHFRIPAIEEHLRNKTASLQDKKLETYPLWCLQQTLFLNPLNDIGPHPLTAGDSLRLPDFVAPIGEPPVLIGLFNQLKQEYVSARWLHFEGINSDEVHPSDRDVLLYNTLDYPAFGLSVEKIKISFRMAYSLLDKIAFFLNYYLKLGIPEKQISFRSVWRHKDNGSIRAQFTSSENWPFRGLHWLSKDLFEEDFHKVAEPEARELCELRNHLEHKYVKVHLTGLFPRSGNATRHDPFLDTLALSISFDDLARRSLHLLRLARSALIYLSLGMHKEEERRRADTKPGALIPPMPISEWDDDWKRL